MCLVVPYVCVCVKSVCVENWGGGGGGDEDELTPLSESQHHDTYWMRCSVTVISETYWLSSPLTA